ncbi:unnamed protein product [Boreogadus saida]
MARTLLSNNKQQALRDKDSFVTAYLRGDKRCVALCVKISPLRDIPYVTLPQPHLQPHNLPGPDIFKSLPSRLKQQVWRRPNAPPPRPTPPPKGGREESRADEVD